MKSVIRRICSLCQKVIAFIAIVLFGIKIEAGASDETMAISDSSNNESPHISGKADKIFKNRQKKLITPARVSIVKGFDLFSMAKEAIKRIGGIDTIVKSGNTVFIKPNYITGGLDGHDPVMSGEISHPAVVASVAEECVKAGAREVIIGEWVERPVKINFGGKEGKEGAQIKSIVDKLNKKYGNKIYLINLMDETTYFQFIPSKTSLQYLAIPNVVAEADVIISVPTLKTHHDPSPVSLGMKNFMGIMPSVLYGEPRYKLHEAGLHQILVDINKGLQPDLVVIDGSFGLENRGASLFLGGETVDVSQRIGGFLVIAGTDPVATDATATRLITKNWEPDPIDDDYGTPWYVHHLRLAAQQGLGVIRQSDIIIEGDSIESMEMNWKPSDDDVYPEKPEGYEL